MTITRELLKARISELSARIAECKEILAFVEAPDVAVQQEPQAVEPAKE
jgi:hypothetical protein